MTATGRYGGNRVSNILRPRCSKLALMEGTPAAMAMSAAMTVENLILSPESICRSLKHGRPGVEDGYPARGTFGQLRGGPADSGERTGRCPIIDVTTGSESASIAVNARLADFCSGCGWLFCRDALGAAEVRRAY